MGFLIIPIIQIKKLRHRVHGIDCPASHSWHVAELTSEPRAEILNPKSLVLTIRPCGLCYLRSFCTVPWNWSHWKKRQTESKSKCSLQPSTCWTQRTWVISTPGKIRRGLCLAQWRTFITEENLQRWFSGNTESTISPDFWHSDQSHFYFATHIWEYWFWKW